MTQIPQDRDDAPQGTDGREPKLVDVRESIRYRRRAQDAESRCAELEGRLAELEQADALRAAEAEAARAEERRRAESLEGELARLQAERRLERELLRAGARDVETALLVARERQQAAEGGAEMDPAELARAVLDEKPYLRGDVRDAVPPLGRSSRSPAPPQAGPARKADRLARDARTTGRRDDLIEYMRARRSGRP